jgi:hypothetical protein
MSDTLVAAVESLRIGGLKSQHDGGEGGVARLDRKMNVIWHQAKGKESETVAGSVPRKQI